MASQLSNYFRLKSAPNPNDPFEAEDSNWFPNGDTVCPKLVLRFIVCTGTHIAIQGKICGNKVDIWYSSTNLRSTFIY